jgi:hypothetical protein
MAEQDRMAGQEGWGIDQGKHHGGQDKKVPGSTAGQDRKAGGGYVDQGQAAWRDRTVRQDREAGEDRSGPGSMAGQDSKGGQEGWGG